MPTNSCQLYAVIWKCSHDLWSWEPAEGAKSPAEPTALLAISKYSELSPWGLTVPCQAQPHTTSPRCALKSGNGAWKTPRDSQEAPEDKAGRGREIQLLPRSTMPAPPQHHQRKLSTEPQICLGWKIPPGSWSPTVPPALPRPPVTMSPRATPCKSLKEW